MSDSDWVVVDRSHYERLQRSARAWKALAKHHRSWVQEYMTALDLQKQATEQWYQRVPSRVAARRTALNLARVM